MKKYLSILIFSFLLFSLVSCQPQQNEELINTDESTQESENQLIEETENSADNSEMKEYSNEEFGIKFEYPQNWIFDESSDEKFLDIHINNIEPADGPQTKPGYVGMEIQSDSVNTTGKSFDEFVMTELYEASEIIVMAKLSGEIEKIEINGQKAYNAQYSGWDGPQGEGYVIDKGDNKYIYIFTGYHPEAKSEDIEMLEQIVESIQVF